MLTPSSLRACAALTILPLLTPVANAWYISDQGSLYANAGTGNTTQSESHNFNSGQVQLPSVQGTAIANAAGSSFALPASYAESAEAHIEDTATVGKLHSTVSAASDTGHAGAFAPNPGDAVGSATDTLSWSDTLHFFTTTPGGSNFTLSLTLNDAIQTQGTPNSSEYDYDTGRASTNMSVDNQHSSFFPTLLTGDLIVADVQSFHTDGTSINNPPANRTASLTFHTSGGYLAVTVTLNTFAYAYEGTGQALVDAGNTSNFNITSDDPLAGYYTDSGTTFTPEETPEPTSLSLLTLATPLLLKRRRPCRVPLPLRS